jgi:hypothetical protein
MKRILFTLLIFVFTQNVFSQGINFQGVARSANGTIIASSNISLKLSIISKNVDATPEYVEAKTVVTNAQGIFSIVVGDATNAVVTGNFKNIIWKDGIKFLKVEMDPAAGTNYINMGATQLQYVPYSFYSLGVDAANVTGVLPLEKGGTGVTTLAGLRTALNIASNIDTTSLSRRIDNLNSILTEDTLYNIKLGKNITTNVPSGYWNIGIGGSNLNNNTTGDRNIGIGAYALTSNVTGRYNIGVGSDALAANISGWNNNAIGLKSLGRSTTGNSNSALGFYSLQNVTEGSENIALGHYAGAGLLAGSGNIFLGNNAGNNNLFANINNRLIIANSSTTSPLIYGEFENKKLKFNANIDSLTILNRINFVDENANDHINKYDTGYSSPLIYSRYFYGHYGDLVIQGMSKTYTGNIHFVTGSNMTGYESPRQRMVIMDNGNVGIGDFVNSPPTSKLQVSGFVSATGYKVPGGTSAQYLRADGTVTTSVTSGVPYSGASQATNLGAYDLTVNGMKIGIGSISNGANTIFGKNILTSNLYGYSNIGIGYSPLKNNISGYGNIAIGDSTLMSNTSGGDNVAIGHYTLQSNTTGVNNTSVGHNTMFFNTTGSRNVSLGGVALYRNTTGENNTSIGASSLLNNTTGNNNVAIGLNSLYANTTASANVAIGKSSLENNTTASSNTAVGYYSLNNNTTGSGNTSIGYESGYSNTTGESNVSVGNTSLRANTTGSNNTAIGYSAMSSSSTYSNSTAIGYNAQITASNQIQLGNSSITDVKTSGAITAAGFKIAGGTSTQTIMADGSVSSSMLSILNKILFVKFINGSRPEIWVANYDGTNSSKVNITLPTGIEFEDGLENLKMSPDGKKIFFNAGPAASIGALYAGSTDIYSCNFDGSSVTKIIDRTTSNSVKIRSAQ